MDLSVLSSALGNCNLYFYFILSLFSHRALNTKDLTAFEYLHSNKMHVNECLEDEFLSYFLHPCLYNHMHIELKVRINE